MSGFTDKVSEKISKLSDEQILRVISRQNEELKLRDNILSAVDSGLIAVNRKGAVVYRNRFYIEVIEPYSEIDEVSDFIKECCSKRLYGKEITYSINSNIRGEMFIRLMSVETSDHQLICFIFQDVTFLKRLHDKFLRNESLAAMTTMAAGVAHEIKNPLASISIYIQLLERKRKANGVISKDDAEKSLKVIADEVERLNSIAVDFLFAVKPMNVKMNLCSLNDAVEKACKVARPELSNHGIELNLDLATSLPKVFADANLVEQCVLNLVRNSMQAIESDRTDGLVVISTHIEGSSVRISVKDNGCGITEEQMSKIFEPYYTTKATGTGLGLTTIFKIMKEHGGEVTASSEIGHGALFVLDFPIPESERFRITGR
ncbi:MAG: ATP-binding protein [Sphaerochaetaceae bacterium]|nr:ATP-binding protein [Sphaerochaetaceae bacterium]